MAAARLLELVVARTERRSSRAIASARCGVGFSLLKRVERLLSVAAPLAPPEPRALAVTTTRRVDMVMVRGEDEEEKVTERQARRERERRAGSETRGYAEDEEENKRRGAQQRLSLGPLARPSRSALGYL